MTIEELSLVAQTLAAVAVVGTFVWLGLQIRLDAAASRASAVATLLSQYDSPNAAVASNKQVASVFRRGFFGREPLDEDEQIQFQLMCTQYLTVLHAAFKFREDGILRPEVYAVFRRDMVDFTSYPGLAPYREYFLSYYAPDPRWRAELEATWDETLPASAAPFKRDEDQP